MERGHWGRRAWPAESPVPRGPSSRAFPVPVPSDQGPSRRSWPAGPTRYTRVPQRPLPPAPCTPAHLCRDRGLASTRVVQKRPEERDDACDFTVGRLLGRGDLLEPRRAPMPSRRLARSLARRPQREQPGPFERWKLTVKGKNRAPVPSSSPPRALQTGLLASEPRETNLKPRFSVRKQGLGWTSALRTLPRASP